MTKTEFIAELAKRTEMSKKDADRFLNTFMDIIEETVAKRESLTLMGFGTFELRERKERMSTNPQNPKETIHIPATVTPAFKVSPKFKKRVAEVAMPKKSKKKSKKK